MSTLSADRRYYDSQFERSLQSDCEAMRLTTSSALPLLLSPDLMSLLDEARPLITEIRDRHPQLSSLLEGGLHRRAAFAIPQLSTELAFHALSGHFIASAQRTFTIQYSLVCLATGIGDDLVDEPHRMTFHARIQLACLSAVLGHSAYAYLIANSTCPESSLVTAAIADMLNRLTSAACAESNHNNNPASDLTSYVSLASQKTTSYTVPAFSLGRVLFSDSVVPQSLMLQLGLHVGTALQLLDDVIDASNDPSPEACSSYAAVLAVRHQPLDPVYDVIRKELSNAHSLAVTLPHPALLAAFIVSLRDKFSKACGAL